MSGRANPARHALLARLTAPLGTLAIAHRPRYGSSWRAVGESPPELQRGTAAAPEGVEGGQKPNFHIIKPKDFNSGPGFGYQHPGSLHRRQTAWMPVGFGWARAVAPAPRRGGGARGALTSHRLSGGVWGPLGANNGSSHSAPAPPSQPRSAGTESETSVFPDWASAVLKLPDKGLIATSVMTMDEQNQFDLGYIKG